MNLFVPPQVGETADQMPVPSAGMDYYGQCRRASEIYCDFFDFVQLEEGRLLLFTGDVAGYGHSSKMIVGGIENLLRSPRKGGLKVLVEEINRSIVDLSPNGLYVTLFCAVVDPALRQLSYVSAGHEPVVVFNRNSERLRRLGSTGTVLGLTARSTYRQHTTTVEAGDILAAFTDGITEAVDLNGQEFREEGVVRVLSENRDLGAAELCGEILASVEQFGEGADAADDQTVAVVRFEHRAAQELVRREAKELAMAAA
jgi:phosphoserine phosphatase RsbU/P